MSISVDWMRITINIKPECIASMFVGAIEANHMTRAWCNDVVVIDCEGPYEEGTAWYANPAFWTAPFVITVSEYDETGAEKDKIHRVDNAKLAAGLTLMAEKHGRHFGAMLTGNDDNVTQDVFLQCVALGEVVYG